jgi:DNA-binding NarL/FixJ family response regulator
MSSLRILLTDDHPLYRKALGELLRAMLTPAPVLSEASHGREALELLNCHHYDLLFLDISMRVMDGHAVLKELKGKGFQIPTIVMTQHNELLLAQHLVNTYGVSFVTKDSEEEIVLAAFEATLAGRSYVSLPGDITPKPVSTNILRSMSDHEIKLLELLGEGLSSKEISGRLGITVKTVYTYRERLLEKTNTKNMSELISLSFRTGLLQ